MLINMHALWLCTKKAQTNQQGSAIHACAGIDAYDLLLSVPYCNPLVC